MSKTLTVIRHEFLATVKRRGFWIGLIVVPIFTGVITLISVVGSTAATAASAAGRQNEADRPMGYVDAPGVLARLRAAGGVPSQYVQFSQEAEARGALGRGEISGFYLIPADVIARGGVTFIADQFTPFESLDRTRAFRSVIELALLDGDRAAHARFSRPVTIERRSAVAPQESKGGVGLPFSPAPVIITLVFFGVLMTASSYLMNGVSTEKENRVMEVLMSSVTPMQLLVGKILGLSLVGLLQLGLWMGSGLSLIRFVPLVSQFMGGIDAATIAWSFVFFVLGYFTYAALLAGLGALMPTSREAAQYTFFVILPLILPMYFLNAFMLNPNGTASTALSLFPLTAPIGMIARMSATDVPFAEIALSAAMLAVTAAAAIWIVTRLFRAQMLLSGTRPSLRQIATALRG